MSDDRFTDFINFLEERLAAHEGGAGSVYISWDDATRDYIISQKRINGGGSDMLGCSRSLRKAIQLAVDKEDPFDD